MEEGYIAFHEGKRLEDNPYKRNSPDYNYCNWQNGWLFALTEKK